MFAVGDRGTAFLDETGYPLELTKTHFDFLAAVRTCGKRGIWAITVSHVMSLEPGGEAARRFRLRSIPKDVICVDGQLWVADSSGSIQLFDVRGSRPERGPRIVLADAPIVALEEDLDGVYAATASGELLHIGFDIERNFEGHELRVPSNKINQVAEGLRCPGQLDSSYGWVYMTQPCRRGIQRVFRDGTVEGVRVPGRPTQVLAFGSRLWVATRGGFIHYFKVQSGDPPRLIGKSHLSGPAKAMRICVDKVWVAHGTKVTRLPIDP
jgi:hypothetical protein